MSQLIRFGKGAWSEANISPERQLMHAQADNRQLIETLTAIADTAHEVKGAELIEQMAILALARSAGP